MGKTTPQMRTDYGNNKLTKVLGKVENIKSQRLKRNTVNRTRRRLRIVLRCRVTADYYIFFFFLSVLVVWCRCVAGRRKTNAEHITQY